MRNDNDIRIYANHGTPSAGIIGANTNRSSCIGINPQSVAGIAGGWGPSNGSQDEGLGVSLWGFVIFGKDQPDPDDYGTVALAACAIHEASAATFDGNYGYGMDILNNSWHVFDVDVSALPCMSLRSAINDAYEHGVSFVAARGNNNVDVPEYPACFDATWVVNVGGSQQNKDKHETSSYAGNIDLLAPFGESRTSEPDEQKTIYTTAKTTSTNRNTYQYFDGTSAAAPHATGVIALLRSHLAEPLDPEDYEGMLKASSMDRNPNTSSDPRYEFGYDEQSGWGHLQANQLFTMLKQEGYTISNFTHVGPVTYGNWTDEEDYFFSNQGVTTKLLGEGTYKVRRREVTADFNLSTYGAWDNGEEVYVWGRGGSKSTGGFSAANPNYQTRWTEVTSGEGGNHYVAGILHAHSNACTARTFQYDVNKFNEQTESWENIGHYPKDEDIAFHLTVLGIPLVTSVRISDYFDNEYSCRVVPNPARDQATMHISISDPMLIQMSIVNALGEKLLEPAEQKLEAGVHEISINLGSLASGTYYCRMEIEGSLVIRPIIITR